MLSESPQEGGVSLCPFIRTLTPLHTREWGSPVPGCLILENILSTCIRGNTLLILPLFLEHRWELCGLASHAGVDEEGSNHRLSHFWGSVSRPKSGRSNADPPHSTTWGRDQSICSLLLGPSPEATEESPGLWRLVN